MSQFWNGEVLAAPNLITVCVDESQASEISGYNRSHRTDLKNPVINHKFPHTI